MKREMASLINGETASTTGKAVIEAIQSIPPSTVTATRNPRRVSPGGAVAGGCVHVVMYFNGAGQGGVDSGSLHAGWIKESLAKALSAQPLIAGRLQRSSGDQGEFDLVSNDAGVRLIEARITAAIVDFAGSLTAESEAELVFWDSKGFDDTDPQFSPLFYVQVTNFACGGYTIGISCSILLADLLLNENTLKTWAQIHTDLLSQHGENPLFYLPNLKNEACTPKIGELFISNPTKGSAQTMVFNVSSTNDQTDPYLLEEFRALARACVEQARSKLSAKTTLKMTSLRFASDSIMIDEISNNDVVFESNVGLGSRIKVASWDDFGANELEFCKGNRPFRVSHWIGSVSSDLVMGIPFSHNKQGMFGYKMIVCFPSK